MSSKSKEKNTYTKSSKGFKNFIALDDFIQSSLNKFFFVDPWEKLYEVTGDLHLEIISNKSTIPDLIIYNKTFNKNQCFLDANTDKMNKFPRLRFILRPKQKKEYNPSCTYSKIGSADSNPKPNEATDNNSKNKNLDIKSNVFIPKKHDKYNEDDEEEPEWGNEDVTKFESSKIEFKEIPTNIKEKAEHEIQIKNIGERNTNMDTPTKDKDPVEKNLYNEINKFLKIDNESESKGDKNDIIVNEVDKKSDNVFFEELTKITSNTQMNNNNMLEDNNNYNYNYNTFGNNNNNNNNKNNNENNKKEKNKNKQMNKKKKNNNNLKSNNYKGENNNNNNNNKGQKNNNNFNNKMNNNNHMNFNNNLNVFNNNSIFNVQSNDNNLDMQIKLEQENQKRLLLQQQNQKDPNLQMLNFQGGLNKLNQNNFLLQQHNLNMLKMFPQQMNANPTSLNNMNMILQMQQQNMQNNNMGIGMMFNNNSLNNPLQNIKNLAAMMQNNQSNKNSQSNQTSQSNTQNNNANNTNNQGNLLNNLQTNINMNNFKNVPNMANLQNMNNLSNNNFRFGQTNMNFPQSNMMQNFNLMQKLAMNNNISNLQAQMNSGFNNKFNQNLPNLQQLSLISNLQNMQNIPGFLPQNLVPGLAPQLSNMNNLNQLNNMQRLNIFQNLHNIPQKPGNNSIQNNDKDKVINNTEKENDKANDNKNDILTNDNINMNNLIINNNENNKGDNNININSNNNISISKENLTEIKDINPLNNNNININNESNNLDSRIILPDSTSPLNKLNPNMNLSNPEPAELTNIQLEQIVNNITDNNPKINPTILNIEQENNNLSNNCQIQTIKEQDQNLGEMQNQPIHINPIQEIPNPFLEPRQPEQSAIIDDALMDDFNIDYTKYNPNIFLENPALIVKKNLFQKHWFVLKENEKVVNFNSEELLNYLESNYKGDEEALNNSKISISDYQTDIVFHNKNIYEILKANVAKLKQKYYENQILKNKNNQPTTGHDFIRYIHDIPE